MRCGVEFVEFDLARHHLPFPFLVAGLGGVELGHHLFREKLEAFADVLVGVLASLVQQDDLVGVAGLELAQLLADRVGRADEATAECRLYQLRIGVLPLHELLPDVDGAGARPLTIRAHAVEAQRELEEGQAFRALAGFLVGFGAHEIGDQRDVRIDWIIRQFLQMLGDGVIVGVHPGVGGVRRDELEAQRPHAAATRVFDRVELRAGDPERRVRFLQRFRHDVAPGELEVRAVVFARLVLEHRDQAADRVLPDLALLLEIHIERIELGRRRTFAHAELDAALGDEIETGDVGCNLGWMIGGELKDAVREPDSLGALAGGAEEHRRRGRVRILLEEMMLDFPRRVVAELVGQLHLVEGVLEELQLAVRLPGAGQL